MDAKICAMVLRWKVPPLAISVLPDLIRETPRATKYQPLSYQAPAAPGFEASFG